MAPDWTGYLRRFNRVGGFSIEASHTVCLRHFDRIANRVRLRNRIPIFTHAFEMQPDRRDEVYVQPMPTAAGQTEQVRISIDGGGQPRWSSDGTELFFYHSLSMYSAEFAVMAVDVETGETFSAGVPRELFRQSSVAGSYDVHPDGERFLILKPLSADGDQAITVVLNWWVEMEERNR